MPKFVEFKIRWINDDSASKIEAIKTVRRTLGCGLKEAKDEVERIDDRWRTWRLTPHQFGLWAAEAYKQFRFPFDTQDVLVIEFDDQLTDWSTMITRSDY